MADREKVIRGLECCLDYSGMLCEKCPYQATEEEKKHADWDCHRDDLERDALELLKEQEPVKPRFAGGVHYTVNKYLCGACGHHINQNSRYCEGCGRAVKWE